MSEMSDLFEGLKEQERHGTTKRYDAERMFGLKEEEGTESRRFWYKNSFMNCSDPQIIFWGSNEEERTGSLRGT
jgi:hypothetical protein